MWAPEGSPAARTTPDRDRRSRPEPGPPAPIRDGSPIRSCATSSATGRVPPGPNTSRTGVRRRWTRRPRHTDLTEGPPSAGGSNYPVRGHRSRAGRRRRRAPVRVPPGEAAVTWYKPSRAGSGRSRRCRSSSRTTARCRCTSLRWHPPPRSASLQRRDVGQGRPEHRWTSVGCSDRQSGPFPGSPECSPAPARGRRTPAGR